MPKLTMEMVLEYAQVFEQNMDKGDAESSEKWMRDLAKSGGQAKVNAYFTHPDQVTDLLAAGFERMATNPKTKEEVDRIKDGNPEFGIGQYLTMKRKFSDVKEIKDKKTGEFKEIDFGGLPGIVDLRDPENKRWWSFDEDGALGNGTRAKVQFEVYGGSGLRLLNIGVTEHVPYAEVSANEDDELFKVA